MNSFCKSVLVSEFLWSVDPYAAHYSLHNAWPNSGFVPGGVKIILGFRLNHIESEYVYNSFIYIYVMFVFLMYLLLLYISYVYLKNQESVQPLTARWWFQ